MVKQKEKSLKKIYFRRRKFFIKNKVIDSNAFLIFRLVSPKYVLGFRITQNNVFCTLVNIKTKNIVLNSSAGKEKINVSRKTLAFGGKHIILNFLSKIRKKLEGLEVLVNITAPTKLKIITLQLLRKAQIKTHGFYFLNTNHKKCFNGCRVKKKKRKKQRGLRMFK